MKSEYPRLEELGVEIIEDRKNGPPGVNWLSLQLAMAREGLSIEKFCKLYGVQTCGANGMYPWDVEDVLERMMSGKKQGTQLEWD